MLPMLYRPEPGGEVVPRQLVPPLPRPDQRAAWSQAASLAVDFWQRTAQDGRLTFEMRAEAGRILDALQPLLDRFG